MDLRSLANRSASVVNPNQMVTILHSTGFTMGAGMKQVPTYAAPVEVLGQVQALDLADIKQLSGLNIQGTIKSVIVQGILAGVVRPDGKGGDLIKTADGKEWLVFKILEGWPTWTKAAVVLQEPA